MNVALARTDTSVFGRWWWTVDRLSLFMLCALPGFGLILAGTASPAVGETHFGDPLHFILRQAMFVPPALAIMLLISMMSPQQVRRFAVIGFLLAVLALIVTIPFGHEVKGARRWLRVFGFSLQASEFVKPAFAVTAAWMFASQRIDGKFHGNAISATLCAIVVLLLLGQPDVGQAAVVTLIWFSQWFLVGLPMIWVALFMALGIVGIVAAYFIFPHVANRVDDFFDPSGAGGYQIKRSTEAFMNGGLFGTGPGTGTVKSVLPDAHADFVFAVVGEEFGLIACLIVVLVFLVIVLRGFMRIFQNTDTFIVLASTGLLVQFALQTLINMASAVNLMPPKGMTLPFLSYGGSSVFGMAIAMGMLLALTRRRPGEQG